MFIDFYQCGFRQIVFTKMADNNRISDQNQEPSNAARTSS